MIHHALIAQRAAEALAEIRRLGNEARAELRFMASSHNRSQGQLRRYARQRKEKA